MENRAFRIKTLGWLALVFILVPPFTATAKELVADELCNEYVKDITNALNSCDYEALLKIEDVSVKARSECLALRVLFARCQYFHSCVRPELDHAYKNCDIDKILKLGKFTNETFNRCDGFVIMQDIVDSIKCIYFPVCRKSTLKKEMGECNLQGIEKLQSYIDSNIFTQCRDYDLMVEFLQQAKSDYFYECQKKKLLKAAGGCDLEGILELEEVVRGKLFDARNFQYIDQAVNDSKCEYFSGCLEGDLAEAARGCATEKFIHFIDHLDSSREKGCDQLERPGFNKRFQKILDTYIEHCASETITSAFGMGDQILLAGIDRLLEKYPENAIKKGIVDLKNKLVRNEVNRKLEYGKADCNIDNISEAESLLIERLMEGESWCGGQECEKLFQQVEDAKCYFFTNCVNRKLKEAEDTCDMALANKIKMFYQSQKVRGECVSLEKVFADFECTYYSDCTAMRLSEMVYECNRSEILGVKKDIKQKVSKLCPDYDRMLDPFEEVLADYFQKCSEPEMYKALETCNLDRLLEIEAQIFEDSHGKFGTPDEQKRQWVAKEIKCSYYDRCLKKYVEFLSHNCNRSEIESMEKTIDKTMSNCANYYIQKKKVNRIKTNCNL